MATELLRQGVSILSMQVSLASATLVATDSRSNSSIGIGIALADLPGYGY